MKKNAPWTPLRTSEAVRLWVEEKKTGGEIAKILGDTTRHAVINKLRSLGITRSSQEIPSDIDTGYVMFEDLRKNQCHFPLWPHDSRPDFRYCGRETVPGSPYCKVHTEKTRNVIPVRKKYKDEDIVGKLRV
jgi:hypothetical protein